MAKNHPRKSSTDASEIVYDLAHRRLIKRGDAHHMQSQLGLVVATLPIVHTNKLIEVYRSPKKEVLGGEWLCFVSEHIKPNDAWSNAALKRGLLEELNYNPLHSGIDGNNQCMDLTYRANENGKEYRWIVYPFVVPIRSIRQLRPDGEELLDIRERNIDDIFDGVYKTDSPYRGFNPPEFMRMLECITRDVMAHWKK
jgi:isopentenyldiphosphate isomerase